MNSFEPRTTSPMLDRLLSDSPRTRGLTLDDAILPCTAAFPLRQFSIRFLGQSYTDNLGFPIPQFLCGDFCTLFSRELKYLEDASNKERNKTLRSHLLQFSIGHYNWLLSADTTFSYVTSALKVIIMSGVKR